MNKGWIGIPRITLSKDIGLKNIPFLTNFLPYISQKKIFANLR